MLQTFRKAQRRRRLRPVSERSAIRTDIQVQERNEEKFARAFLKLARELVTIEIAKILNRELRRKGATD